MVRFVLPEHCPWLEAVKKGGVGTNDAEAWTGLMDVWKGLNEDVKSLDETKAGRWHNPGPGLKGWALSPTELGVRSRTRESSLT